MLTFDSEYRKAAREYDAEIDRRAAELICEHGYAPWDAIGAAWAGLRRQRELERQFGVRGRAMKGT